MSSLKWLRRILAENSTRDFILGREGAFSYAWLLEHQDAWTDRLRAAGVLPAAWSRSKVTTRRKPWRCCWP